MDILACKNWKHYCHYHVSFFQKIKSLVALLRFPVFFGD